jgi:hypothetical protein
MDFNKIPTWIVLIKPVLFNIEQVFSINGLNKE